MEARTEPGREQNAWWRLGRHPVGWVLRAAFCLRVHGTNNIPRTGGGIIVANHVSVIDPVLLSLIVANRGRIIRFLTAQEFFDMPVVGWALQTMGQIPVRRGAGQRASLEALGEVIQEGSLAGIFPEGRIGVSPTIQPGQRGAARVALAAGVSVIPAGIWGTQTRWPRGGPRFRPPLRPPAAVAFGPPLTPQGNPRSRSDLVALTGEIMARIGDLVERARRETFRFRASGFGR